MADTKQTPKQDDLPEGAVVLFDGKCNLCNGSVQFIIDRERSPDLHFIALQSELAEKLLVRAFGPDEARALRGGGTSTPGAADATGDPDSVVLLDGAKGWTRSTAALRIARRLRAPWSWAFVLLIIPRPLRDLTYKLIARNRYRWFGKTETCRVPTPELRARFLA